MCGVIGMQRTAVTEKDLDLVRNLFVQSMIRGKHATGVTYFNGKELRTIKEPIPANEFIAKHDPSEWVYTNDLDGIDSLCFIGHIRYSTSDLRYNQPFQGKQGKSHIAIAHNGVLSQESVETWDYETETANDSEMILRCLESGQHPLEVFADKSMAVTAIETGIRAETDAPYAFLSGFRNHERPLWLVRGNGLIFSSTSDILVRSGIKDGVERTEPFVQYTLGGIQRNWHPMHLGTQEPKDLQP